MNKLTFLNLTAVLRASLVALRAAENAGARMFVGGTTA